MNTDAKTTNRLRSPSYPAIDLEAALSKAAVLWEKARREPIPLDVAGSYWELTPQGSQLLVAAAALKKFGLLEELESNKGRTLKLTDLAVGLIYNPDVSSDSYLHDLQMAALRPSIHRELWDKYQGKLPDDKIIERYLVLERKFNPKYVSGFITQFRKTIEFVKLTEADTLPEPSSGGLKVNQDNAQPRASERLRWGPTYKTGASSEVPIFLGENKYVKVPYPLTEDDYQLLLDQLKLLKKRLVQESTSESEGGAV